MPKRFRFTKTWRWVNLLLILLFEVYFLFITVAFNASPLWLLFAIFTIVLGWTIWLQWSYFIEFGESELTFTKLGLFPKPAKILYTDILYIRRAPQRSLLDMLTSDGKTIRLNLAFDGGIDSIINEFQKHLDEKQIQPNIKAAYRKFSLYEKGIATFVVLMIPMLFFIAPMKGISALVAWKTAWPPLFYLPGNIRSFWINNNQEVWISFRKVFSNNWSIIKLMPNGRISNQDVSDSVLKYPELILADELGQPWIIDGNTLFHLVDTEWQKISFNGYTIAPWRNSPVVIDSRYWVGAYQDDLNKYFLVETNLNTGNIQSFDLPKEFSEKGFFIYQIQPDGKLPIVMITKEYSPIYLYSINNGEWKKEAEIIDVEWIVPEPFINFPIEDQKPLLQFGGFTIDKLGNIWVVLGRNSKSLIGKLDRKTVSWVWSDIENDCNLCRNYYDGILVDEFERVWLRTEYASKKQENDNWYISEGSGIDVWQPSWGGNANLVVRYTNKNSGYEVGFGAGRLRLDDDGKIWSADDRLVWIDSSMVDLPKPLPFNFGAYIPLAYLFVFSLLIIFLAVYRLKLQKYDLSLPPKIDA